MSYEEIVSDAVKVVEAVGASIMVFGGLVVFCVYVPRMQRGRARTRRSVANSDAASSSASRC